MAQRQGSEILRPSSKAYRPWSEAFRSQHGSPRAWLKPVRTWPRLSKDLDIASLCFDQASLGLNRASWAWFRPPLAGLRPRGGWTDRSWRRKFSMCECEGHRPLWGRCPSFSSHTNNFECWGKKAFSLLLWLCKFLKKKNKCCMRALKIH